ncbi:SatD family protein [Rhodococcus rhodochrous]|uniref:SatD family protein n=1 Tax=Rhodococcus rhodochrous TaxID=1829 RepID=A0AAW4X8V4_RHORH|nr:SatD family protein [Rhodococcus rhodochrous]MCD2109471.1 SatD family protein [Rhodococcus rhodochrous]
MFVLTVDQRGSRRDVDRVVDLLTELQDVPLVRPFDRTAGDEVQAVTDDPALVVDLVLDLLRRERWSIGVGIGPVETPLPEQTRAGRGPAFEHARTAVERAKSAPGQVAAEGDDPEATADVDAEATADVDAALTLLATVVLRRTEQGHEAVDLARQGLSQARIAERLGISKQAVSQRLATAGWQAELAGRELVRRLLERADR